MGLYILSKGISKYDSFCEQIESIRIAEPKYT